MNALTALVWRWLEAHVGSGSQLATFSTATIAGEINGTPPTVDLSINELMGLNVLSLATDDELRALAGSKRNRRGSFVLVYTNEDRHFLIFRTSILEFTASQVAKRELMDRQRKLTLAQTSHPPADIEKFKVALAADEMELERANAEAASLQLFCPEGPVRFFTGEDLKNLEMAVRYVFGRSRPPLETPLLGSNDLDQFRGKTASEMGLILAKSGNRTAIADLVYSNEYQRLLTAMRNIGSNELLTRIKAIRIRMTNMRSVLEEAAKLQVRLNEQELALAEVDETLRQLNDSPSGPNSPGGRPPIPLEVQREVWRRDQAKCVQCGSNELLEYDHIIPISLGGSNTVRNIQLLCEKCNRTKGNRI